MHRLLALPTGSTGPRWSIFPSGISRHLVSTVGLALVLGCGGGDDVSAPEGDDPPAGDLPDALVGTWRWEEIGDVICDPNTGLCSSSYARSQSLRLTDDGDFEHVLVYESNLGGCSLEVLHESAGTAAAFNRPTSASTSRAIACSRAMVIAVA